MYLVEGQLFVYQAFQGPRREKILLRRALQFQFAHPFQPSLSLVIIYTIPINLYKNLSFTVQSDSKMVFASTNPTHNLPSPPLLVQTTYKLPLNDPYFVGKALVLFRFRRQSVCTLSAKRFRKVYNPLSQIISYKGNEISSTFS